MWPALTTDTFDEYATVTINPEVYSEAAIFKTAYWFTDRYYVFLDSLADGRLLVELRAKPGGAGTLQVACADFCNSLVDFRVRDIVARETTGIREALVTKAFLEGVPKPGLDGATSDEKHLSSS